MEKDKEQNNNQSSLSLFWRIHIIPLSLVGICAVPICYTIPKCADYGEQRDCLRYPECQEYQQQLQNSDEESKQMTCESLVETIVDLQVRPRYVRPPIGSSEQLALRRTDAILESYVLKSLTRLYNRHCKE